MATNLSDNTIDDLSEIRNFKKIALGYCIIKY